MAFNDRLKRSFTIILFNALWIIPAGLIIFARVFPDQFDKFWEMLFGK